MGRDTLSTGVMPAEAGTQDTSKPGWREDFDAHRNSVILAVDPALHCRRSKRWMDGRAKPDHDNRMLRISRRCTAPRSGAGSALSPARRCRVRVEIGSQLDRLYRPTASLWLGAQPMADDVRKTVDWLGARYVGATLVEFMQRLPTDEAERIHAAALELKRLKAEEERHVKTARDVQLWSWIGGIAGIAAIDALLSGRMFAGLLLVIDGIIAAAIWWFASRAIRQKHSLAGRATADRFRLEESVFQRIGVVYGEADGRVHSIAQLAASHGDSAGTAGRFRCI